jgi:hypothetical protein
MRKGMAERKQGNGTAGAAVTAEELFGEEGALERRLLASAMGLPRVCRVKKCRRRKRCFGLGIICLDEHAGLARKRFPAAMAQLGWDNVEDEKADS